MSYFAVLSYEKRKKKKTYEIDDNDIVPMCHYRCELLYSNRIRTIIKTLVIVLRLIKLIFMWAGLNYIYWDLFGLLHVRLLYYWLILFFLFICFFYPTHTVLVTSAEKKHCFRSDYITKDYEDKHTFSSKIYASLVICIKWTLFNFVIVNGRWHILEITNSHWIHFNISFTLFNIFGYNLPIL